MSKIQSFFLSSGHLKPKSVVQYQFTLSSFERRYKGKDIDTLPVDDILTFLQKSIVVRNGKIFEKPRSASSYNSTYAILKQYYRFIKRRNDDGDYLLSGLKIRKTQKKPLGINENDIKLMTDACRNFRDRAIVSVLADTGMREAELVSMNIGGVQFDKSGVLLTCIDSKSQPRTVRGIACVGNLAAWKNTHPCNGNDRSPLFCVIGTNGRKKVGDRMNPQDVKDLFRGIEARARKTHPGMNHLHPHSLRAWDITICHRKGVDMLTNMQLHGHHDLEMIRTYVETDNAEANEKKLQAFGLKPETKSNIVTSANCPRCGTPNPPTQTYCGLCGTPMDAKAAIMQEKKMEEGDAILEKLLEKILSNPNPKVLQSLKSALLGK